MTAYTPQEIIDFLLKKGRIIDRQKGSHCVMYDPHSKKRTIVPLHKKNIPMGTLGAILRQTGYTKKDL